MAGLHFSQPKVLKEKRIAETDFRVLKHKDGRFEVRAERTGQPPTVESFNEPEGAIRRFSEVTKRFELAEFKRRTDQREKTKVAAAAKALLQEVLDEVCARHGVK